MPASTVHKRHLLRARDIARSLPDGEYAHHFQPAYEDTEELQRALYRLQRIKPVTSPAHIDEIRTTLYDVAIGKTRTPIIITGPCAEPVLPVRTLPQAVRRALTDQLVVSSCIGSAVNILRNRGQNTKPRSEHLQQLTNGATVASYMGDAVNGSKQHERRPDPRRMVLAALQAARLDAALEAATGKHLLAAHEALLLPYEQSFMRTETTNKTYLLSADLPWIGKRTNAKDNVHVTLLAGIENPVGIKIGADSTATHIAALRATLNPGRASGKLIFMVRISPSERSIRQKLLAAVAKHAPGSLIMYDIHGSTRPGPNGMKIRCVREIIEDIQAMARECSKVGLQLHGVHLETIDDPLRRECVDEPEQLPTHEGGIDPQLNPQQTAHVLRAIQSYLL